MASSIRDFKLPDLGEGLEEGEVVEWHVEVGEVIELNATVASIETAKAVVDVPSPYAGTVVERIGEVGQTLEVGSVFLRIDIGGDPEAEDIEATDATPTSTGLDADSEPQPLVGYGNREGGGRRRRRGAAPAEPTSPDGSGPPDAPEESAVSAVSEGSEESAASDGSEGSTDGAGQQVLAKPPVRKLAKDLDVDLATIAPGTGDGGIITRDDVRRAADEGVTTATPMPATSAPVPSPDPVGVAVPTDVAASGEKFVPGFRDRHPGEVEVVRGVRKRIIAKMEQSRREIPHALCRTDADVTDLWEVRRQLTRAARDEGFDVKITPMALVMRATVVALRRFPTLNGSFHADEGEHGTIRLHEAIHLGVAVDTDRGLMVPVIKDAHAKSTLQLAAEAAALAAKCRDGSVTPGELTGGTFTVDNYGYFGNDDGNPIINTPEVGILGMGAIRQRPWVVDDEVVARRVCSFTLAFDHRVADGGEAGRFVTYVANLCEQPATLLLHL